MANSAEADQCRQRLANDGGKRRARHAHGGEAQQAENHDGV